MQDSPRQPFEKVIQHPLKGGLENHTNKSLTSMPRGSKPFVPLSSIKPISQALFLSGLNQWRN